MIFPSVKGINIFDSKHFLIQKIWHNYIRGIVKCKLCFGIICEAECRYLFTILTRYTVHGRGAKTPKLMNSALTTASKITRSSTFWWSYARPRQNLVFKSSKKVSKSRSKPVSICQGYVHFDHFFSTFQKSGFQNTSRHRQVSTPPISRPQKVITFLT